MSSPLVADDHVGRRVERHALVRAHNQTLVLETFLRTGMQSRVDVADATGLSRPTVSVIVDELESLGLLVRVGSRTGGVGRSAAVYRVNRFAGVVVAVDIGASSIRASVADLDAEVLAQRSIDLPRRGTLVDEVVSLVFGLVAEADVPDTATLVVVVGSPGAQDPVTGRLSLTENVPELTDVPLAAELTARLGSDVVVEMDVYLAAVGEQRHGVANDVDTFGLLWVSSGIGLGAMVKGEVLKGAHGAAGEVGYLPLGLDPFASRSRRRGSLEEAAGAAGVRATARRLRNDHPSTRLAARASVDQILAAAQDGDPLGRAVVDHEARLLALAIVAVTVTLDPACVVLGGGVGSHPVLAGPVQRYVDSLSPAPIEVRTSALGESAPLRGAQAVGHDVLIGELLASLSATHG